MDKIKFQVIQIDTSTYKLTHLGTFSDYDKAISYMNNHIELNIELHDFKKCYHNDKNTVSIYEYYYLFPKKLVSKIHIMEFVENNKIII